MTIGLTRPGTPAPIQLAWRPFVVSVSDVQQVCPSFRRVTFTGEDLDEFGHDGPDQRIKVFVPRPGQPLPSVDVAEWADARRRTELTAAGYLRTYTIRARRTHARELDVDFLLHGDGPAATWAARATAGQQIIIIGPNGRYDGDPLGHEWKPPRQAHDILVAGDETALPAIAGIVEDLRRRPQAAHRTTILLEVPEPGDVAYLDPLDGVDVRWFVRRQPDGSLRPHGQQLLAAVRSCGFGDTAAPAASAASAGDTAEIDLELLWEVAAPDHGPHYAWVAGEAGTVTAIRRHLVHERGIDRSSVTFMGYWKLGQAHR